MPLSFVLLHFRTKACIETNHTRPQIAQSFTKSQIQALCYFQQKPPRQLRMQLLQPQVLDLRLSMRVLV